MSQPSAPRKRRRLTFTKRDVARAISASQAAGLSVARVEIEKDGRIVIVPATSIAPETEDGEWD